MRFTPVALALLSTAAAWAQTISGRVYDQTAGVVAGARVVLLQDFNKITETRSDAQGAFAFEDLRAGTYQVQIKQPYFQIFQQLVKLEDKQSRHVRATLDVARAESNIAVHTEVRPGITPAATPAQAFRVGGRVEGLKRLSGRMPPFPQAAAARGVRGTVVLYGTIRTDGSVASITVLESPDPELEKAAVEAWKTWKYEPMKLNGQPVECRELYGFDFQYR
ncbi:MAG TPA: TonB family protein [Bryobacteraceae bacterium]|nr:TonB family protein [Bryobacteraceae bacterium]